MATHGVGTGCTVVLTTSAYAASITGVSQGDQSVPVIDTTHMGSADARSKTTGDLRDEGELTIEILLDNDLLGELQTAMGTVQTCTLTFPKGADTTAAKAVGQAALTSHNYTVPLEDKMVGGYTLTWCGAVVYSDAVA